MTRLIYDTEAGNLSSAGTYSQLIEHLRLAEEACYVLGHFYKAQDDWVKGQGFLAIGEMLHKTSINITALATRGLRAKGEFQ